MFRELRQNGTLEKHLQEKSEEAHQMLRDLTADAPKLQSGYPEEPFAREAEEQVRATLIEFSDEARRGRTKARSAARSSRSLPTSRSR